jgi:hypothetical protein
VQSTDLFGQNWDLIWRHTTLFWAFWARRIQTFISHRKIVSVHRVPHLLLEAFVEQLG